MVIASPSDVKEEREALNEVINRINRNTAERQGLILKTVRWETDTYPGFHVDGPQGLIDPIIKIDDCDILICIFWKRFGTITEDGKTGTEHEFYKAFEAWKQNNKPHIMLYFNQKTYFPKEPEELEQHLAVLKFKANLPKEGLSWDYDGLEQFKELVYDHLTNYLQNIFDIQPSIAESEKLEKKESKKLLKPFSGEKPVFIGRTEYIDNKIKNLLKEPGSRVSIVGIGGSGKSQLAFKALHQYYENDKIIDLVVPVYLSAIASTTSTEEKNDGKNELTVLTFRRFLDEIGSELIKQGILQISEQDFEQLDTEKCKSLVYDALATKKNPSLYCDNFETLSNALEERKGDKDIKEIFNFLNNELPSNTSILVTSRNVKNFLSKEKRIDLEGLKIEESLKVFIEHASTYQQHFSDPDNKKIELLKTIVTKTGGHPLSIEILAKTYEGGGEKELQNMSATLGKQRNNPWSSEERHENLYKCFNYSIERLDESLKILLPKTTIFHSPFPSEAVEQIFEIQESSELLVALYNKSLLFRIEDDEYGSFSSDRFWLYSMHLALRNYLEDNYKDFILTVETKSIPYFYNYYYHLIKDTYDEWGKDDHRNYIRLFNQITKLEISDFDIAIEFAINIQGEQEKPGKQVGANIALLLGQIYKNLAYYEKSLQYNKKALEVREELNDRVGMAVNYNNIGSVYRKKGELDKALEYHKMALEIHKELNDRVGMAVNYNNIGSVYRKKGELDKALEYHKMALEIHKELNDRVGMATDYGNIGSVYSDKGQLDEALKYHKKALEIREELNDRIRIAVNYNNIGSVYSDKGQLDEALKYHKKALEIHKELNDRIRIAVNYNNIGVVYRKKGELDKALEYYKKALEICEELNDRVGMATYYGNIGSVYRKKGELDKALEYYKKALAINETLKDIVKLVRDYSNIGYAYLYKKNKKEANLAADNALKIVKEFEYNTRHTHPLAQLVEELISSLDKIN